jgi:trans-2-enoyl-CoA reductase
LKEHGAFAVVTEDYARSAAFRRLLSDLPKPRLVLNGLGGRAATDAARLLEEKGTFVSYAGKSVQIPTSLLIERGITVTGFSLQRHLQSVSKASFQQLVSDAEKLNLKLLIEKYPLSKFPAALARHEQPFRNRKVVLLNQQ